MRAHGTGSASKAIENKRDESGVRQTVNDGSFLNGVSYVSYLGKHAI